MLKRAGNSHPSQAHSGAVHVQAQAGPPQGQAGMGQAQAGQGQPGQVPDMQRLQQQQQQQMLQKQLLAHLSPQQLAHLQAMPVVRPLCSWHGTSPACWPVAARARQFTLWLATTAFPPTQTSPSQAKLPLPSLLAFVALLHTLPLVGRPDRGLCAAVLRRGRRHSALPRIARL